MTERHDEHARDENERGEEHGADDAGRESSDPGDPEAVAKWWLWGWFALAVGLALLPVRGLFALDEIFYVRDLSSQFWPQHLWLKQTLLAGESPLWDPYVAFGQSAIADPTRQIIFLPTLIPRLLLPDAFGFNFVVAFPAPIAAAGTYLALRRHVGRSGAAVGALVFALSGPFLSTINTPNFSWAAASIPWAIWAADRLLERRTTGRFAALAGFIAAVAVAGEAVTLGGTIALIVAYITAQGWSLGTSARTRLAFPVLAVAASACGLLLAAPQLLPLADATTRSFRGVGVAVDLWSMHPLSALETIVPSLFGDPLASLRDRGPWIVALNDGINPFLYSLYLGIGALALALLGIGSPNRRQAYFWGAIGLVMIVFSLGHHTPIYPFLQSVVPPLQALRYPVKYMVEAALAIAFLSALGWERLSSPRDSETDGRGRYVAAAIGAVSLVSLGALVYLTASPGSALDALGSLAARLGTRVPESSALFLADRATAGVGRLAGLAGVAAICIWAASVGHAGRRYALLALFVIAVVDPLTANANLNPTIDARILAAPEWLEATREHPADRVYIAGRVPPAQSGGGVNETPMLVGTPPGASQAAVGAAYSALLASLPSAWRVREPASEDFLFIWPREYWGAFIFFRNASIEDRTRFLQRTATRYAATSVPPSGGRLVLPIEAFRSMGLFELSSTSSRAAVVDEAVVDVVVERHAFQLFRQEFDPTKVVMVTNEPAAPRVPSGPACEPSASIVVDGAATVEVVACAGDRGGYLVLFDSFDPWWTVEVDGQPEQLLRGDGLFRAVRLAPGNHSVRFSYGANPFYVGLALSAVTAVGLAGLALARRRRAHSDQ